MRLADNSASPVFRAGSVCLCISPTVTLAFVVVMVAHAGKAAV